MTIKHFCKSLPLALLIISCSCLATNTTPPTSSTQNATTKNSQVQNATKVDDDDAVYSLVGDIGSTPNLQDVNLKTIKNIHDPLEGLNRAIFSFNEVFDKYLMRPVANVYNAFLPKPVNIAVDNFFRNLADISTFMNDVLQFKFYQATSDAWRVAINSTVGIGGLIDVSSKMGLERHKEDMGLTFAQWGWKNSFYVVLPFLGPFSFRDAISLPIYYYMTVYPYIDNDWHRWSLLALNFVDIRAQNIRYQRLYDQMAIDPYVFTRNAFYQHRANMMKQNDDYYKVDHSIPHKKPPSAETVNIQYYGTE